MEPLVHHLFQLAAGFGAAHPLVEQIPELPSLRRFVKYKSAGVLIHKGLQHSDGITLILGIHHFQNDCVRWKCIDFSRLQRYDHIRKAVVIEKLSVWKPGENILVKRRAGLHAESLPIQFLKYPFIRILPLRFRFFLPGC